MDVLSSSLKGILLYFINNNTTLKWNEGNRTKNGQIRECVYLKLAFCVIKSVQKKQCNISSISANCRGEGASGLYTVQWLIVILSFLKK